MGFEGMAMPQLFLVASASAAAITFLAASSPIGGPPPHHLGNRRSKRPASITRPADHALRLVTAFPHGLKEAYILPLW